MKRLLFDVPKWNAMLHREHRQMQRPRAADGPRLRLEDELFERLYSGGGDPLGDSDVDPRLRPWAEAFHQACDELPDFGRLAAECRGDPAAAAAATEAVMDRVDVPDPDATQPPVSPPPTAGAPGASFPSPGGAAVAGAGAGAGPSPGAPAPDALRRSLKAACAEASRSVDELRELLAGAANVGWGSEGGNEHPSSDPTPVRALAAHLRGNERLRRIALLAGRMKRIAAAKRRQRVRHGADELSDVEQGAALARALPSELAKLSHPRRRLAFLRSLLEHQVLQYRLSGSDTLGRGPLVLLLDKSDSMQGQRDLWATALALALLQQAQAERRTFALLCFNHGVFYERVVRPHELLPERDLFIRCDGGTDIHAALRRGLALVAEGPPPLQRSDLVLVTDGESDVSAAPEVRARAAELQASILGVAVAQPASVLEPWCDSVESTHDLATLEDGVARQLFG